VKNRKPDRVGRSSRPARITVATSTALAQPAMSAVGDIEMVRERTRGRIALAVIGLLALVILSGVIGLASGKLSVNDVKELITSQTALTALVGTAMGYYFGRTMK
jgi:heme A synthase